MRRSLIAILTIGLASASAQGQQAIESLQQLATPPQQPVAEASPAEGGFLSRPEALRYIALYETAARSAEAAKAPPETLIKIYLQLGGMYEDMAMFPRSEDAIHRAIALLRTGPPDQLADATGHLAVLHIAMGDVRQAEKEQFEALRIHQGIGDPVGIAQSWNDLADLYIKQRQFKKALDYAHKAMEVLGDDPKVDAVDRIAVRQTLAYALCGTHDCAHAVPILKDAIELSKARFGADSLPVGTDYYLLGYTYWQNGNMQDAAEWMERGTTRMKADLGWGHPIYVNAMNQYAHFLRQRGQLEAATTAEREVHHAQAIVDARSLTPRPGQVGAAALR